MSGIDIFKLGFEDEFKLKVKNMEEIIYVYFFGKKFVIFMMERMLNWWILSLYYGFWFGKGDLY